MILISISHSTFHFSNKHIKLLYLGSLLTSVVQSLGATYYGYYIYLLFKDQLIKMLKVRKAELELEAKELKL